MQDGGNSTPPGADEPSSLKPGRASGADKSADKSGSEAAQSDEKVFDFYHQHFGVAVKSGSQDVRNGEANRVGSASRIEVFDKDGSPKSDSWHALKRLIRYQTSGTVPNDLSTFGTTGNTFEAQWFSKSSESSLATEPDSAELSQFKHTPESIRLKWTPIVDNVGGPVATTSDSESATTELNYQTVVHQSYEDALLATARGEHSPLPDTTSILEQSNVHHEETDEQVEIIDAIVLSDSMHQEDSSNVVESVDTHTDSSHDQKSVDTLEESLRADDESKDLMESSQGVDQKSMSSSNDDESPTGKLGEDDDISADEVAEVRSKFGSLNAFERLQKRTKERADGETTGELSELTAGNWDTQKPAAAEAGTEAATVMNQWCSASTGESLPSLEELNSIPTPSVLDSIPTPKVLPGASLASEVNESKEEAPDIVPESLRSSWLKAASDYSASVIKAFTEQMKHLGGKQKHEPPDHSETEQVDRPAEHPAEQDDSSS